MTSIQAATDIPKVLVVDDDRVIRTILVKLLQKEGYQVIEADTGVSALVQYRQCMPDLVLLDAKMPGFDGFTCCQKIRQMATGQYVPILMVTGLEDDESVVRAFYSGATDYVTKPIRPSVVVGRARYLIRAARDRLALAQSEERYRSLVTNLQEVIFQLDESGNLTFLNPVWHKFTGYAPIESLDKLLVNFLHPADRKQYWQQFRLACSSPTHCHQHRSRCMTRTGDWLWIEMQLCANLDGSGTVQSLAGRLTNINDRTRREQYRRLEYAVGRAMANHADSQVMLRRVLQIICGNLNLALGEFWQPSVSRELICTETWHLKFGSLAQFASLTRAIQSDLTAQDTSIAGKIWASQEVFWSDQVDQLLNPIRQGAAQAAGFQSVLGVPVSQGSEKLGVLVFFAQDVRPASGDLFRGLTILANQISQYMLRLRAETELQRQNQMLQLELNRAADYVTSLLPEPIWSEPLNGQAAIEVRTQFQPSSQLGGDAFDYYWLDPDHLAFYLLDVAGHGVKAALLSVSVLNILRKQTLSQANLYEPDSVLEALNRIFQMNDSGEDYFTLWYGVYHRPSRCLRFASAGHPPGILISAEGQMDFLDSRAIAVGMLPDFPFDTSQKTISPGSRLFIFSDGAYEIMAEGRLIMGLDGWASLVSNHCKSQQADLSALLYQVQAVNGSQALPDDFSVMEVCFS